jgi:hypothetical protein
MSWQPVRVAVLAGSILAAATLSARAGDCCSPAPAECGPQFRTVCVNEWVPETYQTTRTVYKTEYKTENFTAYRCETVPEVRTRTVCFYTSVPEVKTLTRTVCTCVPTVEERTCYKTYWHCVPETHYVTKCVDKGHYECCEVPCGPSTWDRLRKHFRHGCCDECCEPCKTKTVKKWVPCPTYIQVPVTCMKKVCETRAEVHKVTVYKTVTQQVPYQCTTYKCVPQTREEKYTVCVTRQVPYQATRNVAVCVPHQETVTCTRMVCHQVQKQVPVETCCYESCKSHHRCASRSFRHHGCCD